MQPILIGIAAGYLLGSIPFGYLLVRGFHGADVRTTGSGNIGATNVARTSPLLGVATLLCDMLKGLGAVELVSRAVPGNRLAVFVAAFSAVAGHIFPVWLRLRGGKGVATGLGAFLILTPRAILVASAIFLAMAFALRFVSLASIAAAASLPLGAFFLDRVENLGEIGSIAMAAVLIIMKHYQNLQRLLTGTEPKFEIRRR